MSRAMQLAMSEEDTLALCASHKVAVSAIESLPGGGVRLVCKSSSGAVLLRLKARSKVMKIDQPREGHRPGTPIW